MEPSLTINSSLSQLSLAKVGDTPPYAGKKEFDASHGNRFQSKLLMFYAMQAINLDYRFYLSTEIGGKFADLIFHYKNENDTKSAGAQHMSCQHYLQTKHSLNEKIRITAYRLIHVKSDRGNFSLLKYFQSYIKIRSEGDY